MLISIIIPNYNCAPYLRQAVESALAQTYQPLEVVVVDDGSTDASMQTIANLVERGRVRLVRQANQGLAAARNAGLAASTGVFVVFLDSDDYLHPDMAARLTALVDAAEPQQLAYCDYRKVSVSGEPLPGDYAIGQIRDCHNGNLLPQLLIQNYIQLNGVLLHRQLLQRCGGFDAALPVCEDYDLLLRLFCHGATARYLDVALAYYRQRPNSLSANRERMTEAAAAVVQACIARFPTQVAAALPTVVHELRDAAARMWRANEQWHAEYAATTEGYVRSLCETLAAREQELAAAKQYIGSLEAAFRDAEAYAHTLEAERRTQAVEATYG